MKSIGSETRLQNRTPGDYFQESKRGGKEKKEITPSKMLLCTHTKKEEEENRKMQELRGIALRKPNKK